MEVEGYRGKVDNLRAECQLLLEKGHYASDEINQRQVSKLLRVVCLSSVVISFVCRGVPFCQLWQM